MPASCDSGSRHDRHTCPRDIPCRTSFQMLRDQECNQLVCLHRHGLHITMGPREAARPVCSSFAALWLRMAILEGGGRLLTMIPCFLMQASSNLD